MLGPCVCTLHSSTYCFFIHHHMQWCMPAYMRVHRWATSCYLLSLFLSGGNYSICNKFLSHLTSLHVGHVISGCIKNYEEWGWNGLQQWHKSHQVLWEMVNWFKNEMVGRGQQQHNNLVYFSFLKKESNLKTLTVIRFLQLENLIAKVCSSLVSVKQQDATYMLISSMGLPKCAVTLKLSDVTLNTMKFSVLHSHWLHLISMATKSRTGMKSKLLSICEKTGY